MLELLNGSPKCTVIERMDGTVKLIGPYNNGFARAEMEFKNLEECKGEINSRRWDVNVAFVKKIIREGVVQ